MKKTYIIPTLNVVEIQPTRILDGSETIPVQTNDYDSGTVTIGARRGRFSTWEEEDFDE